MIRQNRLAERIGCQQGGKIASDEDSALSILHAGIGKAHDFRQSVAPPSRNEQHQIARTIVGCKLALMKIVTSQLALNGFHILLRLHAFGAVVQFHHKVERPAMGSGQLKRTVGIDGESTRLQLDRIVPSEMSDGDPVLIPRHKQMGNGFRQMKCVIVMAVTDFFEVSAPRQSCVGTVQQPVSLASQFVILRSSPAGHNRIRPRFQQAGICQLSQSATQIVFVTKRGFKRLTDATQLSRRERRAVDGGQEFQIAIADVCAESFWHGSVASVA